MSEGEGAQGGTGQQGTDGGQGGAQQPTAGQGTQPQGQQGTSPQNGAQGDSGQGPQAGDKPLNITQAQLDAILAERLARDQRKYEQQIKDLQATLGKTDTEKLTIERDNATERLTQVTQESARRIALTEAKVAAIAAGARPDRAEAIAKNTDLAAAIKDGDVDTAKLATLVGKTLESYPEWKATQPVTTSGGEMGNGSNPVPSLAEFQKMTYNERVELYRRDKGAYDRLVKQDEDAKARG